MSKKKSKVDLFVPGRLCLLGEHSDWAAEYGLHSGYCLVVGTDQGLQAEADASGRFFVETQVCDQLGRPSGRTRQMNCSWKTRSLFDAANDRDEFFRFCAGVAHEFIGHPGVTGGLNLRITKMDLPLGKGVSSSAAVCVLVAKAFNVLYQLGLFPDELMDIAYRGERLTGSQCGRMDQVCVYGKTPVLLAFNGASDVRVAPIFPRQDIYMFFVDLGGRKETRQILADLHSAYPKNRELQRALGSENEAITRSAYRSLEAGDAEELGRLMAHAQKTFDELVAPNSPEQLASPLLHQLLFFDAIQPHVWGGKGVGSQGDGTVQFVARSKVDRERAMATIAQSFPEMQCFPLTIVGGITQDEQNDSESSDTNRGSGREA